MLIDDDGAGSMPRLEYATGRNLLLDESSADMMPEWICLDTWSSGADAKERGRRRRRQSVGQRRGR